VIKVLVVDDSALVRKLFGAVLSAESGFEVRFARNGLEALDELETFKPAVVTLDVHMPRMNGLECLDRIMVQRPCPVVMVSSLTAEGAESTLQALALGAVDFIPKPEGAVSLRMDAFAPALVEKVRAAANAKVRASRRLKERVQHRISGAMPPRRAATDGRGPDSTLRPARVSTDRPAPGEGLVLVGTSTGGPPAVEALLKGLPASFAWPILIAQHMPEGFTGPLARRLDTLCAMRIVEVRQPVMLSAGCAYIGRGDADLIVSRRGGALVAMAAPSQADYPWHPSTDRLVTSAMNHLSPSQLVGVLMTGMGNDGARAMARLHALGGRTIAEAEETAVIWGMPGELVQAGGADWVVPLPEIAQRLLQITPAHATRP
jgi:two-component system, chemotaxis family, protein-glutamate methylesterase/glutaminase